MGRKTLVNMHKSWLLLHFIRGISVLSQGLKLRKHPILLAAFLIAMTVVFHSSSSSSIAAESKVDNEEKGGTFYYCADRYSFPPNTKYFDYDSRPWKEEEKATVVKLLEELKKEAPGVVALASEYGRIPLLKSPNIPYKNILGKTTQAYVLAVDGALFIADGAEAQKDYKRILLHELVHMADLEPPRCILARMGILRTTLLTKGKKTSQLPVPLRRQS